MPFLHHMYLLSSNCLPLLCPSKHFLLDTPMKQTLSSDCVGHILLATPLTMVNLNLLKQN